MSDHISKVITPPPSRVSAPLLLASVEDLIDALPERARAKLLRLRQDRDDAHAIMLPLQDERNDLIRELWELEANIRRLLLPQLHGGNELTEDAPQVKSAHRQVAQKQKRRDELAKLIDERAARRGEVSQLVQRLEGFLVAHAGVALASCEPVEPVLRKGEVIAAAIERIRRRVRELDADRRRVEAAPFPAAECKALARQQVEAMVSRGAPNLLPLVDQRAPVEWPREFTNAVVGGEKQVAGIVSFQSFDALSFLAWLHRDALLARIDEEIGELVDDDQALSDPARAAKLAEIDRDKLVVEREEEALIARAHAEGLDVLRRSDADPRAVLELADV